MGQCVSAKEKKRGKGGLEEGEEKEEEGYMVEKNPGGTAGGNNNRSFGNNLRAQEGEFSHRLVAAGKPQEEVSLWKEEAGSRRRAAGG